MRHPRTFMIRRDGTPLGARRVPGDRPDSPKTEPIRMHPPASLPGEDWETRLANYRAILRGLGLDMARD